jgi:hypothetical protein
MSKASWYRANFSEAAAKHTSFDSPLILVSALLVARKNRKIRSDLPRLFLSRPHSLAQVQPRRRTVGRLKPPVRVWAPPRTGHRNSGVALPDGCLPSIAISVGVRPANHWSRWALISRGVSATNYPDPDPTVLPAIPCLLINRFLGEQI